MRSVCRRAAIAAALLVIALTQVSTIATFKGLAAAGEHEQAGDPADYNIVVGTSEAGGGATWTYTITKAVAGAKDLGQFVISLNTCGDRSATLAHVTAAAVNGVNWLDKIDALEGKTGCGVDSPNFVKFDDLPPADTLVIEFTLDDRYPIVDTTAWLKAGPTCARRAVPGPGCKGYLRTTTMDADASLDGKSDDEINSYMRRFGFDYTENPNCTGGYGAHPDGVHGDVDPDPVLNRPVFRFDIHIDPVIDGDRCSSSTVDRQRNEMKSITNNSTWAKVQGNWDEWQILEWKFKMPAGFQPTQNFGHIHQIKAQDGPNNGSPVDHDYAARGEQLGSEQADPDHSLGGRRRHRQGHDRRQHSAVGVRGRVGAGARGGPLHARWLLLAEDHARSATAAVLIDFTDDHIDMWRIGSSYIRSKFGLYRSLAGGRLDQDPVGQSPLLQNESLWVRDFRVYEKNHESDTRRAARLTSTVRTLGASRQVHTFGAHGRCGAHIGCVTTGAHVRCARQVRCSHRVRTSGALVRCARQVQCSHRVRTSGAHVGCARQVRCSHRVRTSGALVRCARQVRCSHRVRTSGALVRCARQVRCSHWVRTSGALVRCARQVRCSHRVRTSGAHVGCARQVRCSHRVRTSGAHVGCARQVRCSHRVRTSGAHGRCGAHIGCAHQVHSSGAHVRCAPGVSTEREHPSCVPVVRTAPGVRTRCAAPAVRHPP